MSGVVNMLAFYGPKLAQVFTGTARMHDLTTALDEAIPFSPVWVIPYVLTFALWTYQYIMVTHDSEEMANRMFAADTLGKHRKCVRQLCRRSKRGRPVTKCAGCGAFPLCLSVSGYL